MARTTVARTDRLIAIMDYLRGGSRTSDEVFAMWRQRSLRRHDGLVTIDTIQGDLRLLVERGVLRRVRSRQHGHTMGSGSWVSHTEYEVVPTVPEVVCGD